MHFNTPIAPTASYHVRKRHYENIYSWFNFFFLEYQNQFLISHDPVTSFDQNQTTTIPPSSTFGSCNRNLSTGQQWFLFCTGGEKVQNTTVWSVQSTLVLKRELHSSTCVGPAHRVSLQRKKPIYLWSCSAQDTSLADTSSETEFPFQMGTMFKSTL